jgi:hypothetical protein
MSTDGIELMIIIIGTFGQALSGSGAAVNIFGVLIVWRFLVSDLTCSVEEQYILFFILDGSWYRW